MISSSGTIAVHDGATTSEVAYREAWAYVDGLGRTVATLDEADPSAGDAGAWVVNGLTDYDSKGAPRRAYLAWFYSGTPESFALSSAPPSRHGRKRYDAFGRGLQSIGLDGTTTLWSVYHALSTDAWDNADLTPGPHYGTPASERRDGHGRTVAVTERVHDGAALEEREIRTQYLASGEVAKISRVRVGKADPPVIRWMRYDTLGRMVLNVEPNTTKHFNPDPAADASAMKAWRYAYNDAGDLVGTSDARGCGTNYHYDSAGRLLAEDYSPCLAHHPLYSPPVFTPGEESGLEVLNRYDYAPGDKTAITAAEPDCVINDTLYAGRLAEVWDRGARTVSVYDGRGRITCAARKMGKPGTPSDTLADRYAPRWYVQTAAFDAADRPVLESTGAKVAELMGGDDKSRIATAYSARGSVKHVGGSYGTLVASVVHDADGLTTGIVYGDAASTTTAFDYDLKRRLRSVQTYRGPPSVWTSGAISPATTGASTLQLVLEDLEYTYDGADNPIEIRDWRKPADWPAGAKPVTRKVEYDDLYRVTKVGYQYSAGDDTWVSPFHAENTGTGGAATDPRMAFPSPHVAFDKRVLWQSFSYDWLGNTTKTDDDAKGFYDRSLGTITNGTSDAGPYQLKGASNLGAGTRAGALTAKYDDAGYLVSMAVRRDGPCLPTTPTAAKCGQRFVYEWDEAGRLQRARRWDLAAMAVGSASDPEPSSAAAVELRYQYNGGDQRTLKTAVDLATGEERHTVYVSPSLELRRATFAGGEYARVAYSEVPYLFANGVRLARVSYQDPGVPSLSTGSAGLHILLELTDHLGSARTIVDARTSELVEKRAYLAYGATDSDYRPVRWNAFRDDAHFTGKEEDIEVGVTYFGFRFYSALIGRWTSFDPLTQHAAEADLNGYAYVTGAVLASTDPAGLAPRRMVTFEDIANAGRAVVSTIQAGAKYASDALEPRPGPVKVTVTGTTYTLIPEEINNGLNGLASPIGTLSTIENDYLGNTCGSCDTGVFIPGGTLGGKSPKGKMITGTGATPKGAQSPSLDGKATVKAGTVTGASKVAADAGKTCGAGGVCASKAVANPTWNAYGGKHAAKSGVPWKDVVASTKSGPAKYRQGIDQKGLETTAWEKGRQASNGKDWRVYDAGETIGASKGMETRYMRVERTGVTDTDPGTLHGHPITESEYKASMKK